MRVSLTILAAAVLSLLTAGLCCVWPSLSPATSEPNLLNLLPAWAKALAVSLMLGNFPQMSLAKQLASARTEERSVLRIELNPDRRARTGDRSFISIKTCRIACPDFLLPPSALTASK